MQQGCGETRGEGNKAQALKLCKDGILTGRGLHKSPLTAETLLHRLAHDPSISRPARVSDYETLLTSFFFPCSHCCLTPALGAPCTVEITKGSGSRPFLLSLSLSFRNWAPFFPLQLIPAVPQRSLETEVVSSLLRSSYVSIVSPRRCMPRRTDVCGQCHHSRSLTLCAPDVIEMACIMTLCCGVVEFADSRSRPE